MSAVSPAARTGSVDWTRVVAELDRQGWAILPGLLDAGDCNAVAALYDEGPGAMFRSHVVMARYGFGRGEYRYFSYPLPSVIDELRRELYGSLAPVANDWQHRLGSKSLFPVEHAAFLEQCRAAGQTRPTPLLLKYGDGDYNCLHQDLYGEQVFPMQVAILLSEPERDFEGGEFVLTEQRPRMQSRVAVVPLRQGDGVIFAVNGRPVRGTRGDYRVTMRHGVSEVRRGHRYTMGIIFHDAA